ncbi:MAG: cache domain-containing protein [Deltaproteobacteria bacterium]|nr:cache domain-containing protein [Deltaproteobacteria bacterium]
MNIGSKLIFSFLVVTLLPTIFLAFLTTTIISSSKKDDAQETINHNLKAAWMQYYARAYQMQYGMLQASTEVYIKQSIIRKDKTVLKEQLKAWNKFRPYVDLWAVVDSKAITIASQNNLKSGVPLSFNGLVQKAFQKKKSFISTEIVSNEILREDGIAGLANVPLVTEKGGKLVNEGELNDGMMLIVVTPVMDSSDKVIGAIITGDLMNNDSFVSDSLAESIPGSLVTIAMGNVQIATNVVDENGHRTIGHLIPKEVISEINTNLSFRGETSIAQKQYITAFDPIINHDAKIIGSLFVGVPKEKFVELQYRNIKAVTTIALVGLLMATGVASFITYMITRPIKSLTKKAQLVSTGDLNIRVGTQKDGNDEIADLARTFDIMVKSLRDNEDRIKVSQDKLRQQKNLIESIINSLPYCLYVVERNMSIVVWNRHASKACPVCNCKEGEDCSNLNFVVHLANPEIKRGLYEVMNSVFETGSGRTIEQKITNSEGKVISLRISIFPILSESSGPADYVVWMAEDITKNKEIEASIISSEKLAAIGQLAAGIAHEVNNPLGGILNCLYNFKHKKLTEARKAEYLDFMEEGIKRVQNIVRQLLDFSQQHAPELRLTDVNIMIEGIIPLFLHIIKGKDIRLVKKLGQGLPSIFADKHQMEQILVNLILNAIQAVDGEGVIEVSTRFEGNWYCILVSDNGCGIAADNLPKIFDPFFTTKGVGKGTGLGLSVSRGIIERHKGRIEVESQLGKGTTFKIYLPIAV